MADGHKDNSRELIEQALTAAGLEGPAAADVYAQAAIAAAVAELAAAVTALGIMVGDVAEAVASRKAG